MWNYGVFLRELLFTDISTEVAIIIEDTGVGLPCCPMDPLLKIYGI